MTKKIFLIATILFAFIIANGNDVLTVTNNKTEITPSYAQFQPQYFPVFVIDMPEGYTDFELKGSVSNFTGTGTTPNNSHDGTELIFYYHSNAPYVAAGGRAPLQKFNKDLTHIYFTVTNAIKYTNNNKTGWVSVNGKWDGRKYIYQLKSERAITNNDYSLSSYLTTGGEVGAVMVIIGWDKNTSNIYDSTMETYCTPLNRNMIWTILFQNNITSEKDENNNPKWRVIMPVFWINNCSSDTWKANLSN